MDITKIGSAKTLYYHLEKLQDAGFIGYESAKNQHQPTIIFIERLDVARKVPKKNLPYLSNAKEKARKKQVSQQDLQSAENQGSYKGTKLLNNETSKTETKKKELFSV